MESKRWIKVEPIHCHQRLYENTLVERIAPHKYDATRCEALMRFNPPDLKFFYDHAIDHLPGMLEVCGIRQSALAAGHLAFDIPMTYQTVLGKMQIKFLNFGELSQETITYLQCIKRDQTKNRIELFLDIVMMQGQYPVMHVDGNLIAFEPLFFEKKIRKHKTTSPEARDIKAPYKLQKKPFIIEVHVLAEPSSFMQTCEKVISVMKNCKIDQTMLLPLYLNYDQQDSEIRCCFLFSDPQIVDRFVVQEIRSIEGVKATKVRLTLHGRIFPKGVSSLLSDTDYCSAHIFLKTEPLLDVQVWENLGRLPDIERVFPTWTFRDFYEYDRDVTLRVMGKSKYDIEEYVHNYVQKISGIKCYQIRFMKQFVKIQDISVLLKLSEKWIESKEEYMYV